MFYKHHSSLIIENIEIIVIMIWVCTFCPGLSVSLWNKTLTKKKWHKSCRSLIRNTDNKAQILLINFFWWLFVFTLLFFLSKSMFSWTAELNFAKAICSIS